MLYTCCLLNPNNFLFIFSYLGPSSIMCHLLILLPLNHLSPESWDWTDVLPVIWSAGLGEWANWLHWDQEAHGKVEMAAAAVPEWVGALRPWRQSGGLCGDYRRLYMDGWGLDTLRSASLKLCCLARRWELDFVKCAECLIPRALVSYLKHFYVLYHAKCFLVTV